MSFSQEVQVVIAKPELSTQITEPCFVIGPVPKEVNIAVLPSLENLSQTHE